MDELGRTGRDEEAQHRSDAAAQPEPLPRAQIDAYLSRRNEVARSDHEEFQDYLREKQARALAARQILPPPMPADEAPAD